MKIQSAYSSVYLLLKEELKDQKQIFEKKKEKMWFIVNRQKVLSNIHRLISSLEKSGAKIQKELITSFTDGLDERKMENTLHNYMDRLEKLSTLIESL